MSKNYVDQKIVSLMCYLKNSKLLLPIEQVAFAYHNNLIKGLAIYLFFKFYTSGKISSDSLILTHLQNELKIKDYRTFQKHINLLIRYNWLGYCKNAGIYYVRNTKFIRQLYGFKSREAVVVFPKDLTNIQVFLASVLISKEINDCIFYWDVVVKRKLNKATAQWAVAKHCEVSSPTSDRPKYFGLCNQSIARLLGCKQTRACVLKNKAAELGYLEVRHQYLDMLKLPKANFQIRAYIYEHCPDLNGRIRIWKKWENNISYILLLVQVHDEIIPKLKFKRMEKFSAIRLPLPVLKGLNNNSFKVSY